MSNSLRYWEEQSFKTDSNEQESLSKDVQDIINLFNLLSAENKVEVKKIIRNSNIF